MLSNADGLEDGDNRTRNAKAQRRHREKRKAHLKTLEEQNQILTAELDSARRQLGAGGYASTSRMPGGPHSPDSRDYSQILAENSFLREENADLRRQLYSLRGHYGHQGGNGNGPAEGSDRGGWEVKHETNFGAGGYNGGGGGGQGSVLQSPQRMGSSHGRMHEASIPSSAAESSSSASSYPPALDHFPLQMPKSSRAARLPSSSSAPSASPYLPPTPSFSSIPTDPRAHALSNIDSSRSAPMRYEAQMYPQPPPPHSLPRSHSQMQYPHSSMDSNSPHGYQRHDVPEGAMSWGPDAGPPPFSSSVSSYSLGFQADLTAGPNHGANPGGQGGPGGATTDLEDWRANR